MLKGCVAIVREIEACTEHYIHSLQFSQTNRLSASQYIFHCLWKPRVHYSLPKSKKLDHSGKPDKSSLHHTQCIRIHFNIILSSSFEVFQLFKYS